MKTPPHVSPAKVVAKQSARPGKALEQRRTSPRKKASKNLHSHEPAASESTELTLELTKVKCCGVKLNANCKMARLRHRNHFPNCRKFGVETVGRKMKHANSPMKRLDWQRDCTRKRTQKYRAAQNREVSTAAKNDTLSKSSVTK